MSRKSEQSERFRFVLSTSPRHGERQVDVEIDYGNRMLRGITAEIADFPGWRVKLDLSMAGVVTALAVEPVSEADARDAGVTSRMLRRLPLGELAARAKAHALENMQELADAEDNPAWRRAEDEMVVAAIASPTRSGRRGKPDLEYAKLAAVYVQRLHGPTPLRRLAADLGYSESQVRNLLHEARRRGLLTSAPPGGAGGELTSKAIELLKETKP